jgi:O-antigen ligase
MKRDLPAGFAVGIGLMLILPLLNYFREPPAGDFYGEWLSAVSFSIAALCLVPTVQRSGAISASLLIAPLALGAVLLIQASIGRTSYAYDWITWSAYLTLLMLAFFIGHAVRESGLERELTNRLSYALVLAGAVNFLVQIIQVAGLANGLAPFVLPLPQDACRAAGNVAQANQATLLAWMSIMAALYLEGTGRMRPWAMRTFVPCMIVSSVLTTSRMAWLFLALALSIVLAVRAWPAKSRRHRWLTASLLCGGFLLATVAWSALQQSMNEACATALARLADTSAVGYAMRLELWRQAIEVWRSSPLLGGGAGLFMAKAYALQSPGAHQPLDNYTHNVWLQILAEFGLVAALAIAVTFLLWAVSLIRHRESLAASDSVLLFWLGALGVHSMLEFPLYYVHFLVLFGLCAGLLIRPQWALPAIELRLRALVATLSIGVAIGCVAALIDYRRVDRVVYLVTIMLANNLGTSPEVEETLEAASQGVVIFRPLADYSTGLLTPLNETRLEEKIEATQRLIERSPTPWTVLRRIALAVLADDEATALWHAQRLVMFYPRSAPELFRELEHRFEKDAELQARVRELASEVLAEAPNPRW